MSSRAEQRLDALVEDTRRELERRRAEVPASALERRAAERGERRDFRTALSGPGVALIAEHKRRSPSAGPIREGAELTEIVRAYERGGAAALSILTERAHFGGSLDDLAGARATTSLPILRKDFTVDPYQLLEALAWGADAVLLVVGALPQAELRSLSDEARAAGLAAIVEVHDDQELERAVDAGAEIVGINNRNLEDFSVDFERTFELFQAVPRGTTVISESGIWTAEHVGRLAELGVDAVLVGEALMRAADTAAACTALGITPPP